MTFIKVLAKAAALLVSMQQVSTSPVLEPRDSDYDATPGNCGTYSTAWWDDVAAEAALLADRPGNAQVDAYSCVRVRCHNTSGIYLCNDSDSPAEASHDKIEKGALRVESSCNGDWRNKAVSGEYFISHNISVVVGFANCRSSPHRRPETYMPPGPNGKAYKWKQTGHPPRHPYMICGSAQNGDPGNIRPML